MCLTANRSNTTKKGCDNLSNFKNSWGLYPWFVEDGEQLISPSDLESFKKISPYGKVFKCTDEIGVYIVLKYGKNEFKVKPDLYKTIENPIFEIGCNVRLSKDNTQEGTIEDINWHYKNNTPFYYISVNGKRKSTRYFNEDLSAI